MKLRFPKYTNKDYQVLALILLPFTLIENSIIFGIRYFNSLNLFLAASCITALFFTIYFTLCGGIALLMKNRFPHEQQVSRRLIIMIFSCLLMTGLFLLILFRFYESITFLEYRIDENSFVWAYFALGIGNVFVTLLHEGIARYEIWNAHFKETEKLRKAWRQSRLNGLKSQVNPHFLFNSLNSLSSLIAEDEAAAEKFLDEMSKVYRYMLRNDEDHLVKLEVELTFLDSYSFLLQARYGEGFKIYRQIDEAAMNQYLPPLALQAIIENAITQNAISKSSPMVVRILAGNTGQLELSHTLQLKKGSDTVETEAELDNLVSKYNLLGTEKVVIKEDENRRVIYLPLIRREEGVAV